MTLWLDFFFQAFVQALAWLCALIVVGTAGAVVGWLALMVLGAAPKRRSR